LFFVRNTSFFQVRSIHTKSLPLSVV
jgi:hypothetical protein